MNEKVTFIPAKKKSGNTINKEKEKPKLKVVAYCRVSTDSEEQAGSYEMQLEHYKNYITNHSEWELAGIYADEGISGTNTKKRTGFNDMITDCLAGKVDMVITKSISRFARNTIDCLKFVRLLKEKSIPIIFEKENINTMEASGELLLTIMASLAQQESASLSQNVKLGLQFRYQEGKVQINHNHFLGYTKDENGNLVIEEKEAEVIKRIYREYIEGASFRDIAEGLEKDGILTGGKNKKWHVSTIQGILKNEKYIGDALLQKTITTDFIEKVRIKNDGTVPQYYVKDSHEAIIPKDIFIQVHEEMLRRANLCSGENKKKRVYSSKYALSSICVCANCGDIYRRVAWNNRGVKSTVWRCCNRLQNGPEVCDAHTIKEEVLKEVTVKAINQVLKTPKDITDKLIRNVEEVLVAETSTELKNINKKIETKQKELLFLLRKSKDYSKIADEIDELKSIKNKVSLNKANKEDIRKHIEEIRNFIETEQNEITEYSESYVRKYIKQINISEDKFTVIFKSGIEVEIK